MVVRITVWNESKYKFCNFVFELNVGMLLILIYNTNDTIIQYHKAQTRLGRLNFKTFIIVLTMSYNQDTKLYVHLRTTV